MRIVSATLYRIMIAVGMPLAVAAQVQTFPTAAGVVKITPIAHAAAMIQAASDIIYVDPAPPASINGLAPADLILITHDHPDHMNPANIAALSKSGTEIIAPAAVQQTVAGARVLTNGQTITWRKWKITAVPMYNIHQMMPNGKPYHAKGNGNGYVLSYGGKNFYFAGDTEGTPEMSALKHIDVAFIPMNLPYTMTPQDAAAAVKTFHPAIVIPYHYRGQDTQKFADDLKGSGIEVRLLDWYPNATPAGAAPTGQHP